jgi:hypothetical protein
VKWYFALSETTLTRLDHDWPALVHAAVASARRNTTLRPHMLWDGQDNAFVRGVESIGVRVIPHRVSIYNRLAEIDPPHPLWLPIASGCFLRIDIPEIEREDEFVLYTDCDVILLKEPAVSDLRPAFFAAAPETQIDNAYTDLNSGVMLMNVAALRRELPDFRNFIRENLHLGLDQDVIAAFYKGRFDPLDPTLNWKPHWGYNPDAQIVHWHGPKPMVARELLDPSKSTKVPIWQELFSRSPEGYAKYGAIWEEYAEASLVSSEVSKAL